MEIYACARRRMAEGGNPNQWGNVTPREELVDEDLAVGRSFAVCEGEKICGVFALFTGEDPTYGYIEGPGWLNDRPYLTIHRIARADGCGGVFDAVIDWCKTLSDDIRIDTHADNAPMLYLVRKHGFRECGTIYLANGSPRTAFHWTRPGYSIVRISDAPGLLAEAAEWFSDKWGIPAEAYTQSMEEAVRGNGAYPEWYLALDDGEIIGGLGVIENDFHTRPDLFPNVCAVFTVPERRGEGVAGELLRFVCRDMKGRGIDTLYLLTDHTGFYERYGWKFLCMVLGQGEEEMSRMYIHRS